jgi:hypothetical protein
LNDNNFLTSNTVKGDEEEEDYMAPFFISPIHRFKKQNKKTLPFWSTSDLLIDRKLFFRQLYFTSLLLIFDLDLLFGKL